MSFVDLATLTMHRRSELEGRINTLNEKCDRALNNIRRLKVQAFGFASQINCEPIELKERFLTYMKKLDEYMYLITDFNLSIGQLDEMVTDQPQTPVHDNKLCPVPTYNFNTKQGPYNLMDALSEPAPAMSCACANFCPQEVPKKNEKPKKEQVLIAFSSTSSSSESVPSRRSEMVTREIQCSLTAEMENMRLNTASTSAAAAAFESSTLAENAALEASTSAASATLEASTSATLDVSTLAASAPSSSSVPLEVSASAPSAALDVSSSTVFETCNLPAQSLLEIDTMYQGTIISVDGGFFWVITDDVNEVRKFMVDMTEFYQNRRQTLTVEQVKIISCCAYYDEESICFYRALFLREVEEDKTKVELFVVDTGEIRLAEISSIQCLEPQFCTRPPYARCCYLAGVDFLNYNERELMCGQRDALIKEYLGKMCAIEIDDNTSESLGVYIILPSGESLNNIMVQRGLATLSERSEAAQEMSEAIESQELSEAQASGSASLAPKSLAIDDNDINDCPEYEDPVEAVTGYHNRDEADICKFYTGGPNRSCFKGSRCNKRHVMIHPDGWTLDRVEVVGRIKSLPLPAPNTWLKVVVTNVCHFDRVYVQMHTEKKTDEVPEFGVVLPPQTLDALFRDMNSAAAMYTYRPLNFTPAPGEIVAALYPVDKFWYRAKVLTVTRADQCVEVLYIDYGTVLWVKEDSIRELLARFTALPAQALRCVLAGVGCDTQDSQKWAAAKRALNDMVLDHKLDCHVVGRDYDEITVELYDQAGYNVAEQLAARAFVQLREYAVIDDTAMSQRQVVP